MESDLTISYQICEKLVKSQTTSFYMASKTLPYHKRKAIYAVYAFCRFCDNIVDNTNKPVEKKTALNEIKANLISDNKSGSINPIMLALKDVIYEYEITIEYFKDLIIGMESDIDFIQYKTFEQLKQYCYRVASTVGLMCLNIFGYEEEKCKTLAKDLGIAMQLTNIIRDIKEDFDLNRIYIPKEDFDNTGYTYDDLKNANTNSNFNNLIKIQISRAEKYFSTSKSLKQLVNKDSQMCLELIAEVYIRLLKQMNKSTDLILIQRTKLTFIDKISLVIKCHLPIIQKKGIF